MIYIHIQFEAKYFIPMGMLYKFLFGIDLIHIQKLYKALKP